MVICKIYQHLPFKGPPKIYPNLEFWVWKQTIWQLCSEACFTRLIRNFLKGLPFLSNNYTCKKRYVSESTARRKPCHFCGVNLRTSYISFVVANHFWINCPMSRNSESDRCGILFYARSRTPPSEWWQLYWHPIPRMQFDSCLWVISGLRETILGTFHLFMLQK
jgi:hypothetical protein